MVLLTATRGEGKTFLNTAGKKRPQSWKIPQWMLDRSAPPPPEHTKLPNGFFVLPISLFLPSEEVCLIYYVGAFGSSALPDDILVKRSKKFTTESSFRCYGTTHAKFRRNEGRKEEVLSGVRVSSVYSRKRKETSFTKILSLRQIQIYYTCFMNSQFSPHLKCTSRSRTPV